MSLKKIHFFYLIVVCEVLIWSAIKPIDHFTWALEVSPALIGIIVLIITYHRFTFSTLSYLIIAILVILMLIGGHYTYARVPFFNTLKEDLHLNRNYYDRFGHFFKGFFAICVREILLRKTNLKPSKWLIFLVLSTIMALAAGYEIVEWIAAKILGRQAHDFLGTQGDVWDSEWDMSLAFLGGMVSLLVLSKIHNRFIMLTSLKK